MQLNITILNIASICSYPCSLLDFKLLWNILDSVLLSYLKTDYSYKYIRYNIVQSKSTYQEPGATVLLDRIM